MNETEGVYQFLQLYAQTAHFIRRVLTARIFGGNNNRGYYRFSTVMFLAMAFPNSPGCLEKSHDECGPPNR